MDTLRKIEELIEQNRTLERRNEELKVLVNANLGTAVVQPQGLLADLVDLSEAETLIVKFYQHNKIPAALYDLKGKLLFSVGWKAVCTKFLHNNSKSLQKCIDSILHVNQLLANKTCHFYQCWNGINGIAFPVEINGRHIATLVVNQFCYKEEVPDYDFFSEEAVEYGFKEDTYLHAIDEMPRFSSYEVERIIQNATFLTEMISYMGLKKLQHMAYSRGKNDTDQIMSSLLDKILEQGQLIKSLMKDISFHQQQVKENTVSKLFFEKQQKRFTDRLERSEAILNSLLTSLPLGIGFVRSDVFTFVNDQMFRLTGYTPKELIGRSSSILFESADDFSRNFNLIADEFSTPQKRFGETRLVHKDGRLLDVIISASWVDVQAPEQGVAFSLMDISAIKESQRELIRAKEKAEESDRLKSAFLDNISHEIRTPMNAILGFTELIHSTQLNEKQRIDYHNIIQKSGKKLLRLIDDIIDVSKIASNQLNLNKQNFLVAEVLKDVKSGFDSYMGKKPLVTLVYKEAVDFVDTRLFNDDTRLKQVLRNLLSNSLKFTARGAIEFGFCRKDGVVEIYVKDTGRGIPKAQHPFVFDRFRQGDEGTTRQHGGAGIGLSLSKSLVELMGGTIRFESKWRKGTTFYISLPETGFVPIEKIKHRESSDIFKLTNDWSGKTILIAEDEEISFQYLQTLLLPTKVNIKWVRNGQDAIDSYNQYPEISLILMDIKMPLLNGIDATRVIKSKNSRMPIIAQSAYTQSGERQRCKDAGCDDFIAKPVSINKIKSLLERFLDGQ
jgi:PAS domain S-box-containing protein